MRLGLFPENDIQADGELDALATGRQQCSIERECRRLWSVQRLQGIKHMMSVLAMCQEQGWVVTGLMLKAFLQTFPRGAMTPGREEQG